MGAVAEADTAATGRSTATAGRGHDAQGIAEKLRRGRGDDFKAQGISNVSLEREGAGLDFDRKAADDFTVHREG